MNDVIATDKQVIIALRKLVMYVPKSAPNDGTLALYANELRGVRYDSLVSGFSRLKTQVFFPSLGEILAACGLRVPDEEAEETISCNLAAYLLHRTPMSRAATQIFHRYGGLDGFVGLETARDPVDFVRPKVAAAIRSGMQFSAEDIQPPPAPIALPAARPAVETNERQVPTPEQRRELMREIKELANRLRFPPRQERDAG